MKRTFGMSLLILLSGVVLGSGSMYLIHVSLSANKVEEHTQFDVNPIPIQYSHATNSQMTPAYDPLIPSHLRTFASLEAPELHLNSFLRKLTVYAYVAGLSEQDLSNELQQISKSSSKLSHRVYDALQTALVERLGLVNPEAAVKFAVAQEPPEPDWATRWLSMHVSYGEAEKVVMPVVQSVFSDWASHDLKSAINRAKTLDIDAKSNALTGILATQTGKSLTTHRQIAKELGDEKRGVDSYVKSFATKRIDDPKVVWDEVIALIESNNYDHARVLRNIARQWYAQDGLSVLDEISISSLDTNLKSGSIHQLLQLATKENPEQAFQYALNMPSQDRFFTPLQSVVRTWSESDPQAAYHAVSNIEQSGQREKLQQAVVSIWARNEPRHVLENLENFPLNVQGYARTDAIQAVALTSAKEAAVLALEHGEDERVRGLLPAQVMRLWIRQDVEAAVNWVFNGPLSEDTRYDWVSALSGALISSDPRRAFDLALKQKIPEDGGYMGMYATGIEARVIHQIAHLDLELAVELLPQVREGRTRTSAYESLATIYINNGDSRTAFNLGLELPGSDQTEYFQNISKTWVRVDPAGFVETLKDFPTEELRATIASTMTKRWYRDNFTEDQIGVLKQFLTESDRKAIESE